MPITFETRGDHVLERWYGVVTTDEVHAHLLALLGHPDASRIRRSLVDLRITEATFRGVDISVLAQTVVRPALAGAPWRSGVVAHTALDIGLARQLALLAGEDLALRTFEDAEKALDWVRSAAD